MHRLPKLCRDLCLLFPICLPRSTLIHLSSVVCPLDTKPFPTASSGLHHPSALGWGQSWVGHLRTGAELSFLWCWKHLSFSSPFSPRVGNDFPEPLGASSCLALSLYWPFWLWEDPLAVQTVKKTKKQKPTRNAGDLGSTPGLGRSPGKGNGYPL